MSTEPYSAVPASIELQQLDAPPAAAVDPLPPSPGTLLDAALPTSPQIEEKKEDAPEAASGQKSSTQIEEEKWYQIARQAIEYDHVDLLASILLPSEDVSRRYMEALAFEGVRQYKASQKNKKERLLLSELDAFFQQHLHAATPHPTTPPVAKIKEPAEKAPPPAVQQKLLTLSEADASSAPHALSAEAYEEKESDPTKYLFSDLQNLGSALAEALLAHDKAALKDTDEFLKARAVVRANNKVYRIEQISDFKAYMHAYRPIEVSSPEALATLTHTILSLDTPDTMHRYIQALRIRVAFAENEERVAQASLDEVGLKYDDYQKERYLSEQAEERRIKEEKVTVLLENNSDTLAFVLDTLHCQTVEEARVLLTRHYDCRLMTDLQRDEKSEEQISLAENTLYVDIEVRQVRRVVNSKGASKEVECDENTIIYKVLNTEGVCVEGAISPEELPTYFIPNALHLEALKALKLHLTAILEITSQRGHTLPIPSISAFFVPEGAEEKESLFAYAHSLPAKETLAYMQERYASLGKECTGVADRKARLEAQAHTSVHDVNDVLVLRNLARFCQENAKKSPGLKDNTLSLFFYARAYMVSGDESDKEKYLALYRHPETTLSEKQQLFSRLLKKNIGNGRLFDLLESHHFSDLRDTLEIAEENKPLMAYVLGVNVELLFNRDESVLYAQEMLWHVLAEPKIPNYTKQCVLDFYFISFGFDSIRDLQPAIAQEMYFYLCQAICDVWDNLSPEISPAHTRQIVHFVKACAVLQNCHTMEMQSRIIALQFSLAKLKECQRYLTHSFREKIKIAFMRRDGLQYITEVQALIDAALGMSVSPSQRRKRAPSLQYFKVQVEDEKQNLEWLHFEEKKMQADRSTVSHALEAILRAHNLLAEPLYPLFTQWLFAHKDNSPIKEALLNEMRSTLENSDLNNQSATIEQLKIEATQFCEDAAAKRQKLLRNIRMRPRYSPVSSRLADAELIASVRSGALEDYQEQDQIDVQNYDALEPPRPLYAFCAQARVMDAYIADLAATNRLSGITTAILFAKRCGIALTVFEEKGVQGERQVWKALPEEESVGLMKAYLVYKKRGSFAIAVPTAPRTADEAAKADASAMPETPTPVRKEEIEEEKYTGPALYWQMQEDTEKSTGYAHTRYYASHHTCGYESGFEVLEVTRQQLVSVLLKALHRKTAFIQREKLYRVLVPLYGKLLLAGRLGYIATPADLKVKNNYLEKYERRNEDQASYLEADKALIAHCCKHLSRFVRCYIGWEKSPLPPDIAKWYIETYKIACVFLEETWDKKRREVRFKGNTVFAHKKTSIWMDGRTERYARLILKEHYDLGNGKTQLLATALYLACAEFVYLNVSQEPQTEESPAYQRVLYFLAQAQAQEAKHADAIFSNVELLLNHPFCFENGKPCVIGSRHVVLLRLFQTHAPEVLKIFRKYRAERDLHKSSHYDLSVDVQHLSLEMVQDIEKYLSGLSREAQAYEKVFKKLKQKQLEARQLEEGTSAWSLVPYFNDVERAQAAVTLVREEIKGLLKQYRENVLPPGMRDKDQFNALLSMQARFERLNTTSHPSFEQSYRTAVRESSADYAALSGEHIDHSRVRSGKTADVTLNVFTSIDRVYMGGIAYVPNADPADIAEYEKRKQDSLLLTHSLLNRFHNIFYKEAKRLLKDVQNKAQLKQIIEASQPGICRVEYVENVASRVLAFAFRFEVAPPQEAAAVALPEALEATVLAVVDVLRRYYEEQIALIKSEDQEKFAHFLAEMVFLYTCSCPQQNLSLLGLLNWLDRGPVLYRKAGNLMQNPVLYEGPEISLRGTKEKVAALQLMRKSGYRCLASGKEMRCVLETSHTAQDEDPSQAAQPWTYGCKTMLKEQVSMLAAALDKAHACNTWYEGTALPFWVDPITVAYTRYPAGDQYQAIPSNFVPVKLEDDLHPTTLLEKKLGQVQKQVANGEVAFRQQLSSQKAESDQKIQELTTAMQALTTNIPALIQAAVQAALAGQQAQPAATSASVVDLPLLPDSAEAKETTPSTASAPAVMGDGIAFTLHPPPSPRAASRQSTPFSGRGVVAVEAEVVDGSVSHA